MVLIPGSRANGTLFDKDKKDIIIKPKTSMIVISLKEGLSLQKSVPSTRNSGKDIEKSVKYPSI